MENFQYGWDGDEVCGTVWYEPSNQCKMDIHGLCLKLSKILAECPYEFADVHKYTEIYPFSY